ncbi:unnamed protein product, partial [Musa textilis]
CISCLATSIRPLLIRRSGGQRLTPSAAGREEEQGVRTSRRRKEMHQAKTQLGSEKRAEKQFAGNRVLHPIPDTGASPTRNDQHTTGIEGIVEAAMTKFLS